MGGNEEMSKVRFGEIVLESY